MKNLLNKIVVPVFLTIVILVSYHVWIFNFSIITQGDWVFFFNETMSSLRIYYFSTWLGDQMGRFLVDASQAPTYAAYGFLVKYFNFNYAMAERTINLWPMLILGAIGSYLLLSSLFKNKLAVLVGTVVYLFNNFLLQYETGFLTLAAAIAITPLVIFCFMKLIDNLNTKWLLITVVVAYLESAYEFRGFYVTSMVIAMYALYSIIYSGKDKLRILIYTTIFFLLIAMLNSFWLMPLILTKEISNNVFFSRGLFGDQFLDINYATALFHPFWTGGKLTIFFDQPIPFYFWIVPILAMSGLLLQKKNKKVLFFGAVSLLGILLLKQSSPPFDHLYLWLYTYIPGFQAFREASKFFFLVSLGYCVLVAAFFDSLWLHFNIGWKKIGVHALWIITLLIFIWNLKPLYTGEVGTLFVSRSIPNDYIINKDFIQSQSDYSRTLWIPITSRWSLYTNIHPMLSFINESNTDWFAFSKKMNVSLYPDQGKSLSRFITRDQTQELLSISSVKYIYVPLEDKSNDDDFYPNYTEPRQYYVDTLNKVNWLKKVNINTKELAIYENPQYRPHIYTTKERETITKNIVYQKVQYVFISPTQYSLTLIDIKNPTYVNFSEEYSSNWRMHVGRFNWFSAIISKTYFLPSSWHFQNDATLNSFYLDPKTVCKINECTKNSDGTYTINLTLYFTPQSYMYIGLIVSGLTLGFILLYLGWICLRGIKK